MAHAGSEETASTRSDDKRTGRVYTPAPLARFLARRALDVLDAVDAEGEHAGPLIALDPACGDGALLDALRSEAGSAREVELHGVDIDATAVARGAARLGPSARVTCGDFLCDDTPAPSPRPDLVIANPPYVRTQALGPVRAAELRRRFGLVGRVDLLHAFVAAVAPRLPVGGVLAFLGSNRFLTTRSGAGLRRILTARFEVIEVIDLGDTRVFEAAVLPVIVIARRSDGAPFRPRGVRVYLPHPGAPAPLAAEVLAAIDGGDGGDALRLESGTVIEDPPGGPWRITPLHESRFVAHVRRVAPTTFGELAHIRVGVKTTADAVFVRDSFEDLPIEHRPEAELVRPLLRREQAAPYIAAQVRARRILYPHENHDGARRAVDLAPYPGARAWLERHRERLEARSYVAKAGRRWFEIWVPHDPDGWRASKVVFPDISERPLFFLDATGSVVPGNCYWLVPRDGDERILRLVLAVANSSLAVRWYDATCGNRLYHGRRRFITQYVARFPLPDPDGAIARTLLEAVDDRLASAADPRADAAIDALVERLLGES